MRPEISVVIPTHNRRRLLELTLRAVLAQRDVGLEVVIVDDGSADGAIEGMAALADARVRVIRHRRPAGVSVARNRGAEESLGEWLAFCDDDDVWAPDKLARQLAAARETGRKWSYAGAVKVDSQLRIIGGTPPPSPEQVTRRMPHWNVMPGGSSNVIVRAETFRTAGRWDPALVNLADWDLWVRLARTSTAACVAAPLVGYRIHDGNASADTVLVLREARALDGRYGASLDYGELHHYLAWVCLRSGRRRAALAHLLRAASGGQVRQAARTGLGLVARRVRWLRPPRSTASLVSDPWIAQAERWLGPLRASA